MLIGYIPKTVRYVPALLVASNMSNEGIHINLNLKNQVIERYSVSNGTKSSIDGLPGDGTSIDYDEPFVLNLSCDQGLDLINIELGEIVEPVLTLILL